MEWLQHCKQYVTRDLNFKYNVQIVITNIQGGSNMTGTICV